MTQAADIDEINAGHVVVEVPRVRATAAGNLDEHAAAQYLGCSTRWLRKRRAMKALPRAKKIAGRIWYSLADLREFDDLCALEMDDGF